MTKENIVVKSSEGTVVQDDFIIDDLGTTEVRRHVVNVVGNGSDPLGMFCEWPVIRPDGAFQPTIVKTTGHLTQGGLSQSMIKPALLVTMALMSPRLGYQISIMLTTKDPHRAARLVESCRKLVPADSHIEFDVMKPEHLFGNGGRQIRNKCAVSLRARGFDPVLPDLESIMSRGCAVRQETIRGSYDIRREEHRVDFPISIIGVDDGRLSKRGIHPLILRVPIGNETSDPTDQQFVMPPAELLQSPPFKIRKSLARLKPRQVIIPFEEQLRSELASQKREHADSMFLILKNMISILTIINNPPPVTRAELGASFYGTEEAEVSRFLVEAGVEPVPTESPNCEPLTATKIEYHLAKVLLDALFPKGDSNFLTERQKLVFETVWKINGAKWANTIPENGDDAEKIAMIAKASSTWASRENVYEIVSRKSSELYSLSTITAELVQLCKMGLIEKAKFYKSTQYGYYVSIMNPSNAVNLPEASAIQCPKYQGALIDVVNPITLQVDKV